MSSIGVSFAEVYVLRKQHKERMKRIEEERKRRGERATYEGKPSSGKLWRTRKVHPRSMPSSGVTDGKIGETGN
uniref:Uncharacterized protein n=1 Tax=Nelumbo nucifera TaxID=4432 RepID=A0A822ZF60_NELNU|nr:TPA_asm: hypothetical protein HUJ06_014561 [Nelumbo nucifera]